MITMGIDAGLRDTKVVVLRDGKIAGKAAGPSGGGARGAAIEQLCAKAMADAGLSAADIEKTVSTGQGKNDAASADKCVVESVADARAARFLFPSSTSVIDAGADQTHVSTLGEGDAITEVVYNQKCMAGLGLLTEVIADRLGMSLDEISALPENAADGAAVNDGCPVFAEQGALELLNDGVAKEKVAAAVLDAMTVRIASILNDKVPPQKDTTVLIGGLARNSAVVSRLKTLTGIDFLIPDEPEYGAALGCAVIAANLPTQ